MKLVADHNIPFVQALFGPYVSITELPAAKITYNILKNSQILLTRTITPIDAELLSNTDIAFIGSAATGTDHIDFDWLSTQNIALATAAGANASAVVDYVISCIAALRQQKLLSQKTRQIAGIIGYGRIGSKVAALLKQLGFQVLCYDPFLRAQPNVTLVTLEELLTTADLITIHTPLTKTGPYPTHHLLNHNHLQQMKPGSILINSARGSVVDNNALLKAQHLITCLDVWENEPAINLELLEHVFIGTPHIAGYTLEAKYRATEMVYEAAASHFGWEIKKHSNSLLTPPSHTNLANNSWEEQILSVHDPIARTNQLRKAINAHNSAQSIANIFTQQRNLPYRRALASYGIDKELGTHWL